MNHHQLAVLREKLQNLMHKHDKCTRYNEKAQLVNQIKAVRGQIANLGANGVLKMAIVVIKVPLMNFMGPRGGFENITQSYMFWDLDDDSIYTLLEAYLRNGEEHLSKSIVQVPLKKPIPCSLENNKISWFYL